MLEDVRRYVEAAFESINPSRAREVASQLVKGQPVEQVNRVARDLVGWSQRTRERIRELVQAEVKRQLASAGIATRDDLDTLRARVRELERSGGGGGSSGKRSTARKTSSTKSPAKRSAARSSAKRSASRGAGSASPSSSSARPGSQGSSG
jgi:polyhydroxyalkanoate synthesis regulator phasin